MNVGFDQDDLLWGNFPNLFNQLGRRRLDKLGSLPVITVADGRLEGVDEPKFVFLKPP